MSLLARACRAKSKRWKWKSSNRGCTRRLHLVVDIDKGTQEVRELTMPKNLAVFRAVVQRLEDAKQREEHMIKRRQIVWQLEKEVMTAVLAADPVISSTSGDLGRKRLREHLVLKVPEADWPRSPFDTRVKVSMVRRWRVSRKREMRWTGFWMMN